MSKQFYVVSTFRVKQSLEYHPLCDQLMNLPTRAEVKENSNILKGLNPKPLWKVTILGTLTNSKNLRDEGSYYGNVAFIEYYDQKSGKILENKPVTEDVWYSVIMPVAIARGDTRFLPSTYDKRLEGIAGYSLTQHPTGTGMIYASNGSESSTRKNAEALAKDKPYILLEGYDPTKEKLKQIREDEQYLDKVEITLKDKYANPEANKKNYINEKEAKIAQKNEQIKSAKFGHNAIYG